MSGCLLGMKPSVFVNRGLIEIVGVFEIESRRVFESAYGAYLSGGLLESWSLLERGAQIT